MIVLRFNHPLDAETMHRFQARLENSRVIIVDNTVEVFTDEADLIRLDPQCECGRHYGES